MARFFLSAICTLICFVILIVLLPSMRKIRSKGFRMMQEAERAGYVTQGVLVGSNFRPDKRSHSSRQKDMWDVTYQYDVNGKSYYFRATMHFPLSSPPPTLPLYYEPDAPEDAAPKAYGRYAQAGTAVWSLYGIVIAAFLFFYWVVFK